jgi:hypothetical protein
VQVLEEKKAAAMHETKAQNLQAKINALHNIEGQSLRTILILLAEFVTG